MTNTKTMIKTKPATRPRKGNVRLLHAVIGVGALLFGLKAAGLAFSANAAQSVAPAPAAPAAAPAAPGASAAPAAPADPLAAINAAMPIPANQAAGGAESAESGLSDALPPELAAGVSSAAMDVLTSLSERRSALEERQRELDLRANVIVAAEKRVDDKIGQLKALQTRIEQLLGQRDKQETEQLDSLVRVYTAMKPKDAARIFTALDGPVRLGVAARMKPDSIAGILAALPPEIAQKMTVELAGQFKLPSDTAAAAAAASAPAAPTPTAPAPAAASAPATPATPAPQAAATPVPAPAPAAAPAPPAAPPPGG